MQNQTNMKKSKADIGIECELDRGCFAVNRLLYISTALLISTTLVGCKSAARPQSNVWDLYDVRHPVPAQSAVPVSRAQSPYYGKQPVIVYQPPVPAYQDNDATYAPPYTPYQDNDSYYRPPNQYGNVSHDLCDSGEIGIGCD